MYYHHYARYFDAVEDAVVAHVNTGESFHAERDGGQQDHLRGTRMGVDDAVDQDAAADDDDR